MEQYFPFVIIGLFVVFAIVASIWSRQHEKQRQADMDLAAGEMGLQYTPEGGEAILSRFSGSRLFSRGRLKKAKNIIQGETGEVAITLFDFFYTTGYGKRKRSHRQTVACLQSPKLRLPQFTMRPQAAVFDALGKAMGGQNIDFDTHPEFSRMFVLQGSDEASIRDHFSDDVLQFFERQQGVSVESLPDGLCFYRPNKRVEPSGMRDLLKQAYEAFAVFSR